MGLAAGLRLRPTTRKSSVDCTSTCEGDAVTVPVLVVMLVVLVVVGAVRVGVGFETAVLVVIERGDGGLGLGTLPEVEVRNIGDAGVVLRGRPRRGGEGGVGSSSESPRTMGASALSPPHRVGVIVVPLPLRVAMRAREAGGRVGVERSKAELDMSERERLSWSTSGVGVAAFLREARFGLGSGTGLMATTSGEEGGEEVGSGAIVRGFSSASTVSDFALLGLRRRRGVGVAGASEGVTEVAFRERAGLVFGVGAAAVPVRERRLARVGDAGRGEMGLSGAGSNSGTVSLRRRTGVGDGGSGRDNDSIMSEREDTLSVRGEDDVCGA